jgi:hypothetical protein
MRGNRHERGPRVGFWEKSDEKELKSDEKELRRGRDNVGPAGTRVERCVRRIQDAIVRGNLSVFLKLSKQLANGVLD